ncbi:hypothetical protein SAMN05660900_02479 [Megasphaera cerevisiae DSM 20462]|jgi:hypothetical protein|nr:hypothetical protein SAMN05660900_02479 [Megasphaera cerevisiae DSM 20462]
MLDIQGGLRYTKQAVGDGARQGITSPASSKKEVLDKLS